MQYIIERKYIFYKKPSSKPFVFSFSFFLTFFLSLMLISPNAVAIPSLDNNNLPIKINSDNMTYNMEKNTVEFSGKVVVTRGDFILNSDKMQIFLKRDKDNLESERNTNNSNESIPLTGAVETSKATPIRDTSNIDKINAVGNVTFFYGNQSGSSQSATYLAAKNLLTLIGNPIVKDGENTIQGNTIRYYVNERRSEVIGGQGKRVEAIFVNE